MNSSEFCFFSAYNAYIALERSRIAQVTFCSKMSILTKAQKMVHLIDLNALIRILTSKKHRLWSDAKLLLLLYYLLFYIILYYIER